MRRARTPAAKPRSRRLDQKCVLPRLELLEDRTLLSFTLTGVPTYEAQGPAPIVGGQANVPHEEVVGAINAAVGTSNAMLVGTVSGGIWRTTDPGALSPTWTPMTDQYPSLSIGSLATLPTNLDVVYAGIGDTSSAGAAAGGGLTGILRSTDGGLTWQQLANHPAALPPPVSLTNAKGGILPKGQYYVEYTFTDATGESTPSLESAPFTVAASNLFSVLLPTPPAGVTGINVYLTPPDGASGSEVYYSGFDGGGNAKLNLGLNPLGFKPPVVDTLELPNANPAVGGLAGTSVTRIIPTRFNTGGSLDTQIILAGTNVGVFRSDDGGLTWTIESGRSGTGLPAGGVSDLALDSSLIGNGDVLYAAIPSVGVFSAVLAIGGELNDGGHFVGIIPTVAQPSLAWVAIPGPTPPKGGPNQSLNNQPTPYFLTNAANVPPSSAPVITNLALTTRILLAVHDGPDNDVVWAALIQPTNSQFGNQFVGIFASYDQGKTWQSWGVPSDGAGPVDPIGESRLDRRHRRRRRSGVCRGRWARALYRR